MNLFAVFSRLNSIKDQIDSASEGKETAKNVAETGRKLVKRTNLKEVKDTGVNLDVRRRQKFEDKEKQSHWSKFVAKHENSFVYKFYQNLSIVSGSMLALLAFCNDFISDIQVFILVSTIGFNDGDYRCILIAFVMFSAMLFSILFGRNKYLFIS